MGTLDDLHVLGDPDSAERVNNSLLGPAERKVLEWLAANTPGWVTPNTLTAVGFFGALLAALGYALTLVDRTFLWLAVFGWILNWYGDSSDGTLARFRKIERPQYGFYIDHTIDALGELVIGIGFGISPYIRLEIAAFVIIGYLLVNIQVYILTCVTHRHKLTYGRFGATEFRLFAILVTIIQYFVGIPVVSILQIEFTVYDVLFLLFACMLIAVFVISIFINAAQIAGSEHDTR